MTNIPPFDFGIICQSETELIAVLTCLEEGPRYNFRPPAADNNTYCFGWIGSHHVVIAHLIEESAIEAAILATNLRYLGIERCLYIGQAQSLSIHLHPGDVLIATEHYEYKLGIRTPLPLRMRKHLTDFKVSTNLEASTSVLLDKIQDLDTKKKYIRPENAKINVVMDSIGYSPIDNPDTTLIEMWKKNKPLAFNSISAGIARAGINFLMVFAISGLKPEGNTSLLAVKIGMDLLKSIP